MLRNYIITLNADKLLKKKYLHANSSQQSLLIASRTYALLELIIIITYKIIIIKINSYLIVKLIVNSTCEFLIKTFKWYSTSCGSHVYFAIKFWKFDYPHKNRQKMVNKKLQMHLPYFDIFRGLCTPFASQHISVGIGNSLSLSPAVYSLFLYAPLPYP